MSSSHPLARAKGQKLKRRPRGIVIPRPYVAGSIFASLKANKHARGEAGIFGVAGIFKGLKGRRGTRAPCGFEQLLNDFLHARVMLLGYLLKHLTSSKIALLLFRILGNLLECIKEKMYTKTLYG